MQRLTGMDASFLYMETPTHHMHVCGVLIVDPTGSDRWSFDRLKELIRNRLHLKTEKRHGAFMIATQMRPVLDHLFERYGLRGENGHAPDAPELPELLSRS